MNNETKFFIPYFPDLWKFTHGSGAQEPCDLLLYQAFSQPLPHMFGPFFFVNMKLRIVTPGITDCLQSRRFDCTHSLFYPLQVMPLSRQDKISAIYIIRFHLAFTSTFFPESDRIYAPLINEVCNIWSDWCVHWAGFLIYLNWRMI